MTKTEAKKSVVISKRGPSTYAVMVWEARSGAYWEHGNGARYRRTDAYRVQRRIRTELTSRGPGGY